MHKPELRTFEAVLNKSRERFAHHTKALRDSVLDVDEVEFAKRNVIGNQQIGLQSNGAQALSIALDTIYGYESDRSFKRAAAIQKVTPEDVQRVAQKYFGDDKAITAILKPAGKK